MKLEISYKKKLKKNPQTWCFNNMLLNNQWVNEENREKIKKKIDADK